MTDVLTPKQRHFNMSRIRAKNTKPEMTIRKALFNRGLRYKLHDQKLPGKPDLVFPKYGAVILINGCFWHGHNCHLFKWPSTRQEFWRTKINRTKYIDVRNHKKLNESGWRVLIIWECAMRGRKKIEFECLINDIVHWLQHEHENRSIEGI